jgi:hypothetical protein
MRLLRSRESKALGLWLASRPKVSHWTMTLMLGRLFGLLDGFEFGTWLEEKYDETFGPPK